MASYNEEARIIANLIKDKNLVKTHLSEGGVADIIGKFLSGKIKVSQNLEVRTRNIGTAFILGHSSNGVLGTSTLGEGTRGEFTTVIKRVWEWKTKEDFDRGTADDGIDYNDGILKIG